MVVDHEGVQLGKQIALWSAVAALSYGRSRWLTGRVAFRFRSPSVTGPDDNKIPPTGKSFDVDFCTVARWVDGKIAEENLFYDLTTFMKQIGLA